MVFITQACIYFTGVCDHAGEKEPSSIILPEMPPFSRLSLFKLEKQVLLLSDVMEILHKILTPFPAST